jgi:hypothetical protein
VLTREKVALFLLTASHFFGGKLLLFSSLGAKSTAIKISLPSIPGSCFSHLLFWE